MTDYDSAALPAPAPAPAPQYDISAMLTELRTLSPRVSIAQANPQGALASLAAFVADQSRQVLELATSILRERQAAPVELAALAEAVRSQASRFEAIERRLDEAAAKRQAPVAVVVKPAAGAVPQPAAQQAAEGQPSGNGATASELLAGPPGLSPAPSVKPAGKVATAREWL